MKAIQVKTTPEGADLIWSEVADPELPKVDEVLIEVRAAGVNRADLLQARGLYPPPPGESPILGLEVAGTVIAAGPAASGWHPGSRVCALVAGGGYGERVLVDQRLLLPLPDSWRFEMGAAVPEAWLTAFSNLVWEGRLRAADAVLIHAGASGVGTAAIQLAKAAGGWVAATAGTDAKCEACRLLGADVAVNYRKTPLSDALADRRFDLVLDCVGAPHLPFHLDHFNPGGRLLLIGVMGGGIATIDLTAVLMKGLRVQGTRLRARPLSEKGAIVEAFRDRFWPGLVSGRMAPVLDRVFPMEQAMEAHRYLRENRNTGKVVLTLNP